MIPFTSLPIAERQAKVNALLVPAVKRLPLKIRRNPYVMGDVVRGVWAELTIGSHLTQAGIIRGARNSFRLLGGTPATPL